MFFSTSVCLWYMYTYILRLLLFIGPFAFYTLCCLTLTPSFSFLYFFFYFFNFLYKIFFERVLTYDVHF